HGAPRPCPPAPTLSERVREGEAQAHHAWPIRAGAIGGVGLLQTPLVLRRCHHFKRWLFRASSEKARGEQGVAGCSAVGDAWCIPRVMGWVAPLPLLLGVGFSQAVARQVPLTAIMMVSPPLMYAGGSHVSPRGIIKLDRDGVNAYATPESAPGTGAGPVELRDCHDAVMWRPHRGDVSCPAVGAEGRHARTSRICMVRRGIPQSRH